MKLEWAALRALGVGAVGFALLVFMYSANLVLVVTRMRLDPTAEIPTWPIWLHCCSAFILLIFVLLSFLLVEKLARSITQA